MNDEGRLACEAFRTAVNCVRTDEEGYPCDSSQATEWRFLAGLAWGLVTDVCIERIDDEERAWYRCARATWDLIESAQSGSRDPQVAARWFSARADLPPMRGQASA